VWPSSTASPPSAYPSQKPWDRPARVKGKSGHHAICATEPHGARKHALHLLWPGVIGSHETGHAEAVENPTKGVAGAAIGTGRGPVVAKGSSSDVARPAPPRNPLGKMSERGRNGQFCLAWI
jgi:hypothetical protein